MSESAKSSWAFDGVVCTNNGDVIAGVPQSASFTIPGSYGQGDAIVCTVKNKELATGVKVDKVWVVNGTTYNEGSLPVALQSLQAQLKLENTGNEILSDQAWGAVRTGYTVGERVQIQEQKKGNLELALHVGQRRDQRSGRDQRRHDECGDLQLPADRQRHHRLRHHERAHL